MRRESVTINRMHTQPPAIRLICFSVVSLNLLYHMMDFPSRHKSNAVTRQPAIDCILLCGVTGWMRQWSQAGRLEGSSQFKDFVSSFSCKQTEGQLNGILSVVSLTETIAKIFLSFF